MKTLKTLLFLACLVWQMGAVEAQCPDSIAVTDYGNGYHRFNSLLDSMSITGNIDSLYWTFGDASGDTVRNNLYPYHGYTTSGTYNVCLHYSGPVCNGVFCTPLNVNVCNNTLTMHTSPQPGGALLFVLGIGNADIASYDWTFVGGDIDSSDYGNPTVTFSDSGVACVTIVTTKGCQFSLCDSIFPRSVNCGPPTLNIHPTGGSGYSFFANVDSVVLYNGLSSFSWNFGDGDTAYGVNTYHTYNTAGEYTVCFSYSGECNGSVCDTITVNPCANNNLNIIADRYGLDARLYTTGAAYTPITYHWIFTGANIGTSTDAAPEITYLSTGNQQVCVTVSDGTCIDSVCKNIHVDTTGFTPCSAEFTYYQDIYSTTLSFYLADSFSFAPYPSKAYHWDFGDGNTAIDSPHWSAMNHAYTSPGNYTVCLAVVSANANCADTVCHNITVNPAQAAPQWVEGVVTTSTDTTCNVTVYLIQEDTAGHLVLVDSIAGPLSDSIVNSQHTCRWWFGNLTAGTYYVKAALRAGDSDYSDYLPTYYGNELQWANATPVTLNSLNIITLIAGVNPGGPGFVGGWVTQGAGLAIGGQNNESRAIGDPIQGVQVVLLTDNDVPVAYAYTDANGRYTFSNLALGTYKVYAEQINKVPVPATVTLTAGEPTVDGVNVEINSSSAVTGINEVANFKLQGVLPNPTTTTTVVSFNAKQNTDANMLLSDVNGRTIISKEVALKAGANQLVIDLSSQSAGIYYLSLTDNTTKKIIKLVKTQ